MEHSDRRRRLPRDRAGITHKFEVNGFEGYLTVGHFEDGAPGELFLHVSKQGSTVSGIMDALATMVSLGLQYGVPLDVMMEKFQHTIFEPRGGTPNPEIPEVSSILDYIARFMLSRYA